MPALVAKGCDRLDNLRHLQWMKPEKQREQIRETKEKYFPIFKRMAEASPVEYRAKAAMLFQEIRIEVSRHEERFHLEDAAKPPAGSGC